MGEARRLVIGSDPKERFGVGGVVYAGAVFTGNVALPTYARTSFQIKPFFSVCQSTGRTQPPIHPPTPKRQVRPGAGSKKRPPKALGTTEPLYWAANRFSTARKARTAR